MKNVTLLDGELLRFPDARSERGRKHLNLLMAAVAMGLRGVMLFALNRPEGRGLAPAWDVDPLYAKRLCEAAAAGVEVLAVRLVHGRDCIDHRRTAAGGARRWPGAMRAWRFVG